MKLISSNSWKSFILFGIVGASGAVINTLFLFILTHFVGLYYILASVLATEIAILSNFFGNNNITFKAHTGKKGHIKFIQFQLISMSTIIGTVFILFLLTSFFGKSYLLIWNLISIGVMSIANYFLNTRFTWEKVLVSKNAIPQKEMNSESISESKPIKYINKPISTLSVLSPIASISPPKLKVNPYIRLGILISLAFLFLISSTIVSSDTNPNYFNDNSTNLTIIQTNSTNTSIDYDSSIEINLTNSTQNNISITPNSTTLTNSTIETSSQSDSVVEKLEFNNFSTFDIQSNPPISSSAIGPSLVAISQLGYHPNSTKQVIVYTNKTQGTFNILNSGVSLFTGPLVKLKDASGNNVSCQGNQPCLIGDFTNFKTEGSYTINASEGANTPSLLISKNIYQNNMPVFFEFFNAQQQQNSNYHANFHSGYNPPFVAIADGSFLMEASQAGKALVRLGSAYNRNPSLFVGTDSQKVIKSYTDYLRSLQGLTIQNMSPSDPDYKNGFRLNALVKINNVFYPGPIPDGVTSMNIYSSPGVISDPNVPVTSLCGSGSASNSTWKACIDYAANFYKCQID